MNPWYTDYSDYLARKFPGGKVQKISIDAGFSCPNRDGTISRGGCVYCNVRSFSPSYCSGSKTVGEQLRLGKEFFARKYPDMRYLTYFQAYTNTFSVSTERLLRLYDEALAAEGVVGLVIGTRPDCLPERLLDALADINREKPVIMELGAESSHNETLRRVNRGHLWGDTVRGVEECVRRGLDTGLHLIAGLPGESDEDVLESVKRACELPITSLKLHQLQIIRDTELCRRYESDPESIALYGVEAYLELCARIVGIVPRRIAIDRFTSQAPAGMLVAPRWRLKNHEFTDKLHRLLRLRSLEE